MKRQWVIGAIVLIAGAGFVGWIATNTYWGEVTVPARLRGEAARNPFYTAQRLTEELGATSEWRRTLGEMPDPDALLVLTYWHWDLIGSRRVRLERWVDSGGRLVLVGDLMGGAGALREWSGLAKDYPDRASEDADDAAYDPEAELPPVVSEPARPCNTLRLAEGRSHTNPSRRDYSVCGLGAGRLVSSREPEWALADALEGADGTQENNDRLQIVRVPVGRGSVTWINAEPFGYAQPFGNSSLLLKDHGVLFADALQLHRGDDVVFVSEEESASLLELIWTYGSPAVVLTLVLVGLALWRNAARFGPMAASLDVSRRSLAEQIRGTAQFVLRVGGGQSLHVAMVRALHEAARLRIPNYERMKQRDRISAISRLARVDDDKLAEAIDASPRHHAHEFRNTVALLDGVRRNLMAEPTDETRPALRRARKRAAP